MLPPSFQKQTVFDLAMHTIPEQRQTATSGYMLFCNDHRSQMTDLQSTPSLDMKQWLDERWNALSQTHKKKYHQRAIIINSQMEEGDELDLYTSDNDSDNSLPLKRSYEDTCIPSHKYPVLGPTHIVSPEAIREAEEEEKEEAMGISRCRAFSAFPSFLSLKNMHERAQQQKKQRLEQDPMAADSHAIHVRSFSHSHSPPSVSIPMFSPTISHSSATDSPRLSDAYHSDEETFPLSPPEIATCSPPSATSRIQHEPRIKIEASTSVQPLFRQNNANYQTKEKTRLKRPPNAYLLFNRDMRRELLKISPKLTVAEISKEVGDRWRILSKEKRQSYNEEAMKLKEQHIRDHPDFIYTRRSKAELAEARRFSRAGRKASTSVPSADGIDVNIMSLPKGLKSDDPKRQCKNTATGPNDTRRDPRGRKKKRHRHPSAPKHPMSGFLFFLAAVRPEVARQFPGCTVGPISKAISDRWRALSEEERTPWLQKAEQDKARYAHEMRLYLANLEPQEPGNASAVETTVDDHTLMASVPHAANGAGDQTQLASFPGIT
ncbi:high mobility group box domain-containing protein [Radiomyces spectabilis]|uniref:high mobility group box domain-containing protein n=1 Tax=Radiomyces spectabilis TaxID=64574 RepID=UPI00221FB9AC|nr:high mobility group box domain-containing protein [Radiomyces spectabilis]KAI8393305.1 high mobility group box domain-containing protein [Radiomyces spectabilis]